MRHQDKLYQIRSPIHDSTVFIIISHCRLQQRQFAICCSRCASSLKAASCSLHCMLIRPGAAQELLHKHTAAPTATFRVVPSSVQDLYAIQQRLATRTLFPTSYCIKRTLGVASIRQRLFGPPPSASPKYNSAKHC